MAVKSAYYNGVHNRTAVFIPNLAYRQIVSVKREGLGHNIVDDIPGNREVQYVPGEGKFLFDIPFTTTYISGFGLVDQIIPEKIFIIWKE